MSSLSNYLVESILFEEEKGIIVLFPGGFKPPHGGHLDLAKRYAALPSVKEVRILIGPAERDGITREQSLAVWSSLLVGFPQITTHKVSENNPLLAAYKYIETAKPGTYALASSNKEEDYERVRKFVAGHSNTGKYHRSGVNVVELSVKTDPLLYKNRPDNLNGKPISARILRADIGSKDYLKFKTNYPGVPDINCRAVFQILTKGTLKESLLLVEGGAAGHLAHPYEDMDLTFEDVKNMIEAALSGKLEYAQEKLDGQNFMVTYKDGKVRAARNKGQVKNYGANSLTTKQVLDTFQNRGDIQAAFYEAMADLETAINKLSKEQKEKFFKNGKNFVNLEILYPATANVIPYGATELRLHHIKEYDEAGNVVGEDVESARQLQGAIRQVQADRQKTYQIKTTNPAKINTSKDLESQKEELLEILEHIRSSYQLKTTDKLGVYLQAWWSNYIRNVAKGYNYKIEANVLQQLVNRWAFYDRTYNIKNIREMITNEDFRNWVADFDKKEFEVKRKDALSPIENLFLKLGVYTLRNVENLTAVNPDETVNQIKGSVKDAIEQIKAYAKSDKTEGGTAALSFLKRELTRLKNIGGFKAILPIEGVVFKYNGKLYKLTGAFSPINQLLGYMKY